MTDAERVESLNKYLMNRRRTLYIDLCAAALYGYCANSANHMAGPKDLAKDAAITAECLMDEIDKRYPPPEEK